MNINNIDTNKGLTANGEANASNVPWIGDDGYLYYIEGEGEYKRVLITSKEDQLVGTVLAKRENLIEFTRRDYIDKFMREVYSPLKYGEVTLYQDRYKEDAGYIALGSDPTRPETPILRWINIERDSYEPNWNLFFKGISHVPMIQAKWMDDKAIMGLVNLLLHPKALFVTAALLNPDMMKNFVQRLENNRKLEEWARVSSPGDTYPCSINYQNLGYALPIKEAYYLKGQSQICLVLKSDKKVEFTYDYKDIVEELKPGSLLSSLAFTYPLEEYILRQVY